MDSQALLNNVHKLFRGLVVEYAPGFIKGALVKMLSEVTVEQAALWVEQDYFLLEKIPERYRHELATMNLGKLDWLTADWVIDALKKDKPQLASLFHSWRKGHNWLERQCQLIIKELTSGPKPN